MLGIKNALCYADYISRQLWAIHVITRNDLFVIDYEDVHFMYTKSLVEQGLSTNCIQQNGI